MGRRKLISAAEAHNPLGLAADEDGLIRHYVLDGLFDHDTILEIEELFTDTGGASDHVFALFCLIGKRFAPRLRNIKDRKFHTFEKADSYPALAN